MRLEIVPAAVAVALALHGCGGDDGSTTSTTGSASSGSTTTTTTTTTTSTSTLNPDPPAPMDGKAVADLMNEEYNGYKEGNNSAPFGNWIRVTSDPTIFYCGGDCFQGKPDCKVSGSVLNWKQMIDTNGHAGGWFAYQSVGLTGFYVNSSMVSNQLAKCAYAWDGASDNKVNMGCGCPQGTNGPSSCDPSKKAYNESAYNNKVPPNYTQTPTAESINVAPCYCHNKQQSEWPTDGEGSSCYWKGPAFDTSSDSNPNEIHEMLDWRVGHQDQGGTGYGPAKLIWNEVNLDGKLLQKALSENPAATVLAMVYSDEHGPTALQQVQQMVSAFTKKHKLSAPLPIIRLDTSVDVRSGKSKPWVFETDMQLSAEALV